MPLPAGYSKISSVVAGAYHTMALSGNITSEYSGAWIVMKSQEILGLSTFVYVFFPTMCGTVKKPIQIFSHNKI